MYSTTYKRFSKVCFCAVAHADDWQLFMMPKILHEINNAKTKIIFIITTAGDAGKNKKFWLAREEGSKSSFRFCKATGEDFKEKKGKKIFNHHSISYWQAANAIFYFFRLPDGNLDGKGFKRNRHQSITRLLNKEIFSIEAVDKSTAYKGPKDFYNTLQKYSLL